MQCHTHKWDRTHFFVMCHVLLPVWMGRNSHDRPIILLAVGYKDKHHFRVPAVLAEVTVNTHIMRPFSTKILTSKLGVRIICGYICI